MGLVLVEKYHAVIKPYKAEDIILKDCDSYLEAYQSLVEYIDEMDDKLLDSGDSIFRFKHAKIEKRFVREYRK